VVVNAGSTIVFVNVRVLWDTTVTKVETAVPDD
jgi:hypothetical protein